MSSHVGIGERSRLARLRDFLGARSEDVGGEDVELGGLVDGFAGVLSKEAIPPGDQVVQVGENCLVHVGGDAMARYHMWPERFVGPLGNRAEGGFEELLIRRVGEVTEYLANVVNPA